jgi:hypothetical protein
VTTATIAAVPPLRASQCAESLVALKDVQEENGLWALADAMVKENPSGDLAWFGRFHEEAVAEGLEPKSVHTLRMWRDTAAHWPVGKRFDGVSFSAHRETQDPTVMQKVVDSKGTPGAVTVTAVRNAQKAKSGKIVAPKKSAAGFDAVADLEKGGKQLIAAIASSTSKDNLDRLHVGLSAVLAHVENLQVKAARASRKRNGSQATASAASSATKAKAAGKSQRAGDLRGL